MNVINKEGGIDIEEVTYSDWRNALAQAVSENPNEPLAPLLFRFQSSFPPTRAYSEQHFKGTKALLAVPCPYVTEKHLQNFIFALLKTIKL